MATPYPSEPDNNDNEMTPEELEWPEMDVMESIIMDIRDYVRANKTGAHIKIDINIKSIESPVGRTLAEKYSIGAASINDSSSQERKDNKEIDSIIVDQMQEAFLERSSSGLMHLPPEIANLPVAQQMDYIAARIENGEDIEAHIESKPSVNIDNLKNDFMSFEHLEEMKRQRDENGK